MDFLLIFGYCDGLFAWHPRFGKLATLLGQITRIIFQEIILTNDLVQLSNLINKFLSMWDEKFAGTQTTYNFHLLSHLPQDIFFFGPSHTHNLFPYEGFNHNLNQQIHSSNNFEKRIFKNYNFRNDILKIVEERRKLSPKFDSIVKKLEKLKGYADVGFHFQGTILGYRVEKFCSFVCMKNKEIGQVALLENGEIVFESLNGEISFITESEISEPLMKCPFVSLLRGKFTISFKYYPLMSINDLF